MRSFANDQECVFGAGWGILPASYLLTKVVDLRAKGEMMKVLKYYIEEKEREELGHYLTHKGHITLILREAIQRFIREERQKRDQLTLSQSPHPDALSMALNDPSTSLTPMKGVKHESRTGRGTKQTKVNHNRRGSRRV
jgi:hypothetical protein